MKKKFSISGIVVGVIIVFIGVYTIFGFRMSYIGARPSSCTFGADYYTEQYGATRNAANNIAELGEFIDESSDFAFRIIGLVIIAFGCVTICYFGCQLADEVDPPLPPAPIIIKQDAQKNFEDELPDL